MSWGKAQSAALTGGAAGWHWSPEADLGLLQPQAPFSEGSFASVNIMEPEPRAEDVVAEGAATWRGVSLGHLLEGELEKS